MALVSIIIPTKNRVKGLYNALYSVISQTYKDIEIIVVNDGGKDVCAVINRFNDCRITYLQHGQSRGVSAARNTALKHAKGKYIAYLDDDDIFYPNHLETLISFLEGSDYKVAYSDAERLIQRKIDGEYITVRKDVPLSYDFDPYLILVRNFIWTPSIVHERCCLDEVGLFDEDLPNNEDWDMWIRMSRRFDFAHIRKVTCAITRRLDRSSLTFERNPEFLETTKRIYGKHRRFAESRPVIRRIQERSLEELKEILHLNTITRVSESSILPMVLKNRPEVIRKKVSVIIRAKEGKDLPPLISRIRAQKRVDRIEVICLGPGANGMDGVKAIHSERGLSRGEAFNMGAQEAAGDLLVFTEEGFVPVNNYWLYNLVSPFLEYPELAALSSRIFPPRRGDAFDRWVAEEVERTFKEDAMWAMPCEADGREWRLAEAEERRRITLFRSISSCLRKEVHERLPFPLEDGIDLDYGVRLLEGKMRIGYMVSTGVSPIRSKGAVGVLKDAYRRTKEDVLVLKESLSYYYTMKGVDYKEMVGSILGLYSTISAILDGPWKTPHFLIKDLLSSLKESPSPPPLKAGTSSDLHTLLMKLSGGEPGVPYSNRYDLLLPDILSSLEGFLHYLYGKEGGLPEIRELVSSLYKVFARAVGSSLAVFFLEAQSLNTLTPSLERMDALLDGSGE